MDNRVPAAGERPTVAVLVLNYNYAHYVGEAIESVLAQSDPFDEIIVVNDGSTDSSMEVIGRYAGRVQVVDKPNGGQLTATLAGLARSHADYIYVLDADDVAEPHLVAEIRPRLSGRPVKVQWRLTGIDAQGAPLMSVFPSYPAAYDTARIREDNGSIGFYICPPTAGNLYSRAFLDKAGLDRLGPHEPLDGPPAMAAPYFGEVVTVERPLARYRVHGDNLSRWDRPDASLLQGEIDWFHSRWAVVAEIVGEAPPFGSVKPLYVRERLLMLSALADGRGLLQLVSEFVARLWRTHISLRQKFMLTAWAAALLAPSPSIRRAVVNARRSPVNRPRILRQVLGVFLGGPARTAA